MSRIGKNPIKIPEGVEIKIEARELTVKGPKGELQQKIHPLVNVEQKDNQLLVKVNQPEDKRQRSLWGLFASLIENMVEGVTNGYEKKLEVNGVGYRVELKGDVLILNVGYSHPIEYKLPEGITASVEKNLITISGIDKQLVGEVAAQIRKVRKPEPYKGKGIKYEDEVIIRKVGKAAAKGAE
ncbi:MAG: 50S ribosomal protein L6 [Candidatus Buchananbacteria bacterium]|nr:50S ribosomal protein L6 [Candidatus Buchananbacteria bacterium]